MLQRIVRIPTPNACALAGPMAALDERPPTALFVASALWLPTHKAGNRLLRI